MNKRQHKKYLKKWRFKSYYNVRREKLYKAIYLLNGHGENIIYAIDSKRGDFKHIIGYKPVPISNILTKVDNKYICTGFSGEDSGKKYM